MDKTFWVVEIYHGCNEDSEFHYFQTYEKAYQLAKVAAVQGWWEEATPEDFNKNCHTKEEVIDLRLQDGGCIFNTTISRGSFED